MTAKKPVNPLADSFYLIQDKSSTYFNKDPPILWDPWPVNNFRAGTDVVFSIARSALQQHNRQCIDNWIDRIVLLPASSGPQCRAQGGSYGTWLYSMRSPSTIPVRVVLWMSPAVKAVR